MLKNDLHKSINILIDNSGLLLFYNDPYNMKYNHPNELLSGKLNSETNWNDISDEDKEKIIKIFKLSEELANKFKKLS